MNLVENKICSKCKIEKPNTEVYFHLDKNKVKLGHNIILASACKDCKNAQKRIYAAQKRKEHIIEYGSTYKYRLAKDNDYLDKHKKRELKYYDEKINRNKRYRKEKRNHILNSDKQRSVKNKEEAEIMTDYYISRLIFKNDKTLSMDELMGNKNFIELYKLNLKIKRLCRQ